MLAPGSCPAGRVAVGWELRLEVAGAELALLCLLAQHLSLFLRKIMLNPSTVPSLCLGEGRRT